MWIVNSKFLAVFARDNQVLRVYVIIMDATAQSEKHLKTGLATVIVAKRQNFAD